MKHLKIKILEILILITIISSLIVIFFLAKETLNQKPETSESNQIKNYSTSRIFEYEGSISETYIYQIPYIELANLDLSNYIKYITSTDNIINTYTEKIKITYNYLLPEQENIIKNYCNTYGIIELEYKFQCFYSNNNFIMINTYYIDKIKEEPLKNNHNIELYLPIKKNTKLNEYIYQLNELLIYPVEVNEIK